MAMSGYISAIPIPSRVIRDVKNGSANWEPGAATYMRFVGLTAKWELHILSFWYFPEMMWNLLNMHLSVPPIVWHYSALKMATAWAKPRNKPRNMLGVYPPAYIH